VLREIEVHWQSVDTNNDGSISLDEFLAFEQRQLPRLRTALMEMDEMTFAQRWLQVRA
jgi:hypothetical protein